MRIHDVRRDPSFPRHESKTFRRREVADLKGLCVHHVAGGDNFRAMASYHVRGKDGPGAPYTFGIDYEGGIWLFHDLDRATWSQGGRTVPDADHDGAVEWEDGLKRANTYYLAIVLGGSFHSRYNDTGEQPRAAQVLALSALLGVLLGDQAVLEQVGGDFPEELRGALGHLGWRDVYGHHDFGKVACPGDTVGTLLNALNATDPRVTHHKATEWQRALDAADCDPGPVDGRWGMRSREALERFQAKHDLPLTGHRDPQTAARLFSL